MAQNAHPFDETIARASSASKIYKDAQAEQADDRVFYLNFLVLEAKPFQHPGQAPPPKHDLGFSAFHHLEERDVDRIFSPHHPNAEYVSSLLPLVITEKLKHIGIRATAEPMYPRGSFCALKLTILHVNETIMNSHKLISLSQLVHSCTGYQLEDSDAVDDVLALIYEKLPDMLEEDGVQVEIVAYTSLEDEIQYIDNIKKFINVPQVRREYCTPASFGLEYCSVSCVLS
ncbi:unnamed protein product [Durusdinium trenchii]|uniref:Uncharacterized protein n=1 Tax=Durusdinium trenchii TaxID=1381693 RepID=A0ABP0S618_9DINO